MSNGSGYSVSDLQDFIASVFADKASGQVPPMNIIPYAYPVQFLTLTTAAPQVSSFQVQANADFVLLAIKVRATVAAAQSLSTVNLPMVRMLATDTGSQQQLTNTAVDLINYATGQDGCFRALPYPRVISGRSSLNVQVTNYSNTPFAGETYATLDLLFEGVQIYKY